jgi:hypothetical protein
MSDRPQWWRKPFIFVPLTDQSRYIMEAVQYAMSIISSKTAEYIRAPNVSGKPNVTTGAYGASFKIMVDRTPISNISQLEGISGDSKVQIVNVAPYASTSEVNALYHANTQGIIYYAAKMLRKSYPQLGVSFTYPPARGVPGSLSKYQTPMLTIGNFKIVSGKMVRPGKNYRRRNRINSAAARPNTI